jgi:rhodanese-related sulfurtransferase
LVLSLLWSAGQAYEPDYEAPEQVAGATTITVEQAKSLHDSGVPFVDVRNPRLYARRHIPGAVHLDLYDDFNLANLHAVARPDEPVVFYCSGARCSRSSQAAEWAVEWGHSRVHYFRGGIVAWRDRGLPLDGAEVD